MIDDHAIIAGRILVRREGRKIQIGRKSKAEKGNMVNCTRLSVRNLSNSIQMLRRAAQQGKRIFRGEDKYEWC